MGGIDFIARLRDNGISGGIELMEVYSITLKLNIAAMILTAAFTLEHIKSGRDCSSVVFFLF